MGGSLTFINQCIINFNKKMYEKKNNGLINDFKCGYVCKCTRV